MARAGPEKARWTGKKKRGGRWSYNKMLIDWVRSGRTGKYLALGHGARTSRPALRLSQYVHKPEGYPKVFKFSVLWLLFYVSLLTTKEHPGKVKKNLQGSFFIIYEKVDFWIFHKLWKNCLAGFFFTLPGWSLVVNSDTDKILGMIVRVSFP